MATYSSSYTYTFPYLLQFVKAANSVDNTTEDAALYAAFDVWIGACYARISEYCNQTIQSTVNTFSFNSDHLCNDGGGEYILLPALKLPITLGAVTYKADVFATAQTISGTYLSLQDHNGLKKLYFDNAPTGSMIFVSAAIGYTEANMPATIKQIVAEMVYEIYQESPHGKDRLGKSTVGESIAGGGNVSTGFYELNARHRKLLKPYRLKPL